MDFYSELIKNLHSKESRKKRLANIRAFEMIKERLSQNQQVLDFYNPFFVNVYYTSLFASVLELEANSIDLLTITKSIHPQDITMFYFLLREVLEKINPTSIKSSKLKALMLELNKERT